MPRSIPSYLRARSLSSSRVSPPALPSAFERIPISNIDTPERDLRKEILIGFHPRDPHYLVTLSRPPSGPVNHFSHDESWSRECQVGWWHFNPLKQVQFHRRLEVDEDPSFLPISVAATCYSELRESYYQVLFMSAIDNADNEEDNDGSIQVRYLPTKDQGLIGDTKWTSLPEDEALLGGICWNLLTLGDGSKGYITAATNSRVYFFTIHSSEEEEDSEVNYWTFDRFCGLLIFEVDIYLQTIVTEVIDEVSTRLLNSSESCTSRIMVFVSCGKSVQTYILDICPLKRQAEVREKSAKAPWNLSARIALVVWCGSHKLLTSHCCEDECREYFSNGQTTVFKTWYARGQKPSLNYIRWGYGDIVIDGWGYPT